MEDIIANISSIYQKEKDSKSKDDSPQKKDLKKLTDKIYILTAKDVENKQPSPKNKKQEFSSLYEELNEKELLSFIENNSIPIKYLTKVLKSIFKILSNSTTPTKSKNSTKKKDLQILLAFIDKNKKKLTEKHILFILKKIKDFHKDNIDELIKYILVNIKIDNNYFMEILKEDDFDLNENIIDALNNCINIINEEDKLNFINLIKSLNLIYLLKEIINKEKYDKFEDTINKIYDEEMNKKEKYAEICDKEFNEDFNIEFINSMKIINSNPNKAYYIQEKIKI